MKAAELREMSDEQLTALLHETTESLFRLGIQAQTERLDAPTELKKHRRLIARIHTIQGERGRAAAKQAAGVKDQQASGSQSAAAVAQPAAGGQ